MLLLQCFDCISIPDTFTSIDALEILRGVFYVTNMVILVIMLVDNLSLKKRRVIWEDILNIRNQR